jgi:hypothetical protein
MNRASVLPRRTCAHPKRVIRTGPAFDDARVALGFDRADDSLAAGISDVWRKDAQRESTPRARLFGLLTRTVSPRIELIHTLQHPSWLKCIKTAKRVNHVRDACRVVARHFGFFANERRRESSRCSRERPALVDAQSEIGVDSRLGGDRLFGLRG